VRPRLISAILSLSLFLLMPALTRADSTLGGSSTSSLEAAPASCVTNPNFCAPGGLLLSGGASGNGYSIGLRPSLFCLELSVWSWCSGGANAIQVTINGVSFPGFAVNSFPDSTISQDASGVITMTMNNLCNFSVGCYSFAFDLAPDPVMLSALVPPTGGGAGVDGVNFADLTVIGGCYTTSTSCSPTSSTPPPTTPEPSSLLLFGLGLVGVGGLHRFKVRKPIAQGLQQGT
jgi:hypothetical protein